MDNKQQTISFLLEIGTEEIPAADLNSALEQLYVLFAEFKEKQNIFFKDKDVEVLGTPRRLSVLISNFPTKQKNTVSKKVKGPPFGISFKNGKPTQAAIGFAKAQGIKVSELKVEATAKGDYLFAVSTKQGNNTYQVLAKELPLIIDSLDFTKTMRWQDNKIRFIRPIRWLVALLGDKIINFSYGALNSSNITYGHRLLCPESLTIDKAVNYKKIMTRAKVEVDPEKRARIIERSLRQVTEGKVDLDDVRVQKTFCEVVNLVEKPSSLVGCFNKKFLKLPKKVVETVLQSHQRYFPIVEEKKSKKLTNAFIVVQNGNARYKKIIKHGHEKVVRARLEDAEFYFEKDSREKLSERVKELKNVVFQDKLGTLFDKTRRLQFLVTKFAQSLDFSEKEKEIVSKAAYLSKADLLTSMVSEFDELQGFIGAEYALKEGEDVLVAKALSEQYLPKYGKDERPQTKAGSLLSIADRLDTLCAYISIGIIPTSAGDPYALRRQATGLVDIIINQEFELPIRQAASITYKRLANDFKKLANEQIVVEKIFELVNQRLEYRLSQMGIDYDIIRAVVSLNIEQPFDIAQRAVALQSIRRTKKQTLVDIVRICDRASSIADDKLGLKVDASLLQEKAEKDFYSKLLTIEDSLKKEIADKNYKGAIETLCSMVKIVDRFFDDVLVMAKEESLKRNRHALLNKFVNACYKVADMDKIVKNN